MGIRVQVTSQHLPTHSRPREGRFAFSYAIEITNESTRSVQLLSRHWQIQHGNGKQDEVRGSGVVGQQPSLVPGQRFEYSSGCVLETPHGTMHGTYQMVAADGTRFDVDIAPFTLAAPFALN